MTDYAHPEALVSTQWLAEHLDDPDVRVVEVDMDPQTHVGAHIRGAAFWSITGDVLQPDMRIHTDPKVMGRLLGAAGITPETTVVAYGGYPGTGSWIYWLLRTFGHRNVRVLDGGHGKWVAEGRPVAPECSTYPAVPYAAAPPDPALRVLLPEVQAAIEHPERVLVDVRSVQEYRGEQFMMAPPQGDERGGHIPGAIHIEHHLALREDGTFKPADELRALYEGRGITPDKEILPYCAIGGRSGCTWFVLEVLLGYPRVRNYDGSWNEWGRRADTPVEP